VGDEVVLHDRHEENDAPEFSKSDTGALDASAVLVVSYVY
jgi:hypothetical protein